MTPKSYPYAICTQGMKSLTTQGFGLHHKLKGSIMIITVSSSRYQGCRKRGGRRGSRPPPQRLSTLCERPPPWFLDGYDEYYPSYCPEITKVANGLDYREATVLTLVFIQKILKLCKCTTSADNLVKFVTGHHLWGGGVLCASHVNLFLSAIKPSKNL